MNTKNNNSVAISLWDYSARERAVSQEMTADVDTDVAIVGGGFTGNSTALHLAEKGVECHVFEAEKIGYGGSGRNVGLVNPGLWLQPQRVRAKLGDDIGARFVRLLAEAPEYVFSLIEKHNIHCEPRQNGTIHAAHSPAGFEDIRERSEEWKRLGAPVDLLSRDEAAERIGTRVFHGGLLDHRAGTINPMGYVRGLARAAQTAGATVYTGVKVTALKRDQSKWTLETTRGRVRANRVVLGTNAYSDQLWPGLNRCFTMIHYFQCATEPLGQEAESILPERQGVWDTAPIMFNVRRDDYDRLLIGSMGRIVGGENGLTHRWAKRNVRRLFPQLGPVNIQKSWYGQIAMTPDHLPRVYQLDEGLYTPIGYNGRGITPGTIFGRDLANLLTGGNSADLPIPITGFNRVASSFAMSRLYSMAFTANQVWRSL
ncbi:MAG: FAD-binding oxidoreductase [Pseudomonadota bacterium]